MKARLPAIASAVIAVGALALFVKTVAASDDPRQWLAWRYLLVMLQAAVFLGSALAAGTFLGRWLLRAVPLRQRLVMALGLGVLAWALGIVAFGLVGLLGRVAFFALPIGFLGAGGPPLLRLLWRAGRLLRRLPASRIGGWARLRQVLGVVAVLIVWVPVLTPRNVAYDAMWYHLPLAEQYAAGGAIFRLDEGWFNGTMPHLASYLYTWAFLTPFGRLFDSIELAAHLELVLFLATVASVPVLIDVLLPRPRLHAAWAGFFLFPGIFLYDSSLGGGADHVLAFWAIPLALAFRWCWRRPSLVSGAVFGAFVAGAALTKYQGIFLLIGPALAVLGRLAFVRRASWKPFLRASLVALAAALVLSMPHWALNVVWHHNPIYPHLSNVFPSTPLAPGVDTHFTDPGWAPTGTAGEKALQTLAAVAAFGFEAHDWETFHGKRPVFGSLLLVALGLLPFASRRRGPAALIGGTLLAVPIWFLTQHQDRYLQALVPWAAVAVVVVFASVWRRFLLTRFALAGLMAFQLLHTGDLWSLPAHSVMHVAPIVAVTELVSSPRAEFPDEQLEQHLPLSRARGVLPPEAKVLLHDLHLHLGLGRRAARDHVFRQGAFSWAAHGSTAEAARVMKEVGLSHVLWSTFPTGWSALGDDAVFYRIAQLLWNGSQQLGGGFVVAPIDFAKLSSTKSTLTVIGCAIEELRPTELNARWESLYHQTCSALPTPEQLDAALPNAEVVVIDARKQPASPRLQAEFSRIFERQGFEVWGRR